MCVFKVGSCLNLFLCLSIEIVGGFCCSFCFVQLFGTFQLTTNEWETENINQSSRVVDTPSIRVGCMVYKIVRGTVVKHTDTYRESAGFPSTYNKRNML